MVVPTAAVIFGRWAFHKEIPSSRVKHSIASRPSRLIVMWDFRRCECRARSREFNLSDGMRRPVSAGCDTLPMFDVLKAQRKGDRL
jgi:hypothetical protein